MSTPLHSRLFDLTKSGKLTTGEALMLIQGSACLFAIIGNDEMTLEQIREITRKGLAESSLLCGQNLGALVFDTAKEAVAMRNERPSPSSSPSRN